MKKMPLLALVKNRQLLGFVEHLASVWIRRASPTLQSDWKAATIGWVHCCANTAAKDTKTMVVLPLIRLKSPEEARDVLQCSTTKCLAIQMKRPQNKQQCNSSQRMDHKQIILRRSFQHIQLLILTGQWFVHHRRRMRPHWLRSAMKTRNLPQPSNVNRKHKWRHRCLLWKCSVKKRYDLKYTLKIECINRVEYCWLKGKGKGPGENSIV